jgi:phosphoglycerate kinase
MRTIDQLPENDLNGKKVLLRVDFNVPLTQLPTANRQPLTKIGESFRIRAQKETIDYLMGAGAKVLMVGHLGHEVSNASFNPIIEELGTTLGRKIVFVPLKDFITGNWRPETGNLFLIDNIRQEPREMKNDKGLALSLSKGFNFYVNDAFAVCHREHTSVSAITEYLPSYAGFLVKKETEKLSEALKAPAAGKIIVLGGAKISTKLPVIKNFLDKAEKILIGGALANNFFKARGIEIGASVVDNTGADISDPKVILPGDIIVTDDKTGKSGTAAMPLGNVAPDQMIADIGPESAEKLAGIIQKSEMVIWNGPMGIFEIEKFAEGTKIIAQAVASASHSIIGGGDTIAAADKLGLLDRFSFVSTGGGAMLEFLAGNKLPGLESLGYYS